MARTRKPTALLELNGTIAQRPARYAKQHRENEPVVEDGIGNPPKTLSTEAKKVWSELRKTVPWLTIADRVVFEAVCKLTVKLRSDTYKCQDLSILSNLLGRLGMTPADRSKVQAPPKKNKNTDDPFAFLDSSTTNSTSEDSHVQ